MTSAVPDGEAVAGVLDTTVTVGHPLALVPVPDAASLAVTTGQQPALFGGPMYTVHKALGAAALAGRLSNLWGRKVEPVFWIAGDDHDWTEATGTAWWAADRSFRSWEASPREGHSPSLPMYREPLPEGTAAVADAIVSARMPSPSARWAAEWLKRHWHAGATVHGATAGALAELFEPLGIRCIDPTAVPFKEAQAGLLREALDRAGEIDDALARIPESGTGIEAGSGATLVFIETAAGRERLLIDGSGFRARRSGMRWPRAELLDLLDSEPVRFSANVLLRPVVEAALIPTVAYVAGPGEYRYLTRQAATVYQVLGRRHQLPVPRWSGTMIDVVSNRLIRRLGISPEQAVSGDRELELAVLRSDLPAEVSEAVARMDAGIAESFGVLERLGPAIDPVLERALAGRRRHLEIRAGELRALLERHHRRRDDIATAQYRRVLDALRPGGTGQERVISVAAGLVRWGGEWLRTADEAARNWAASLPILDEAARE